MAFFTPGGKEYKEIFGGVLLDPTTGQGIRKEDAIKNGAVPDNESFQEAQELGYTGKQAMEDQAAKDFANQQMNDPENPFPNTTLNAPASIIPEMDKYASKYMPNYGKAEESLGKLNDIANSTGLSPYASVAMSDVAGKANAATGNALSNLAQTGGFDTGARTSLARAGTRNEMTGRQGVLAADMQYKQGLQEKMPSMYADMAKTGASLYSPYMTQLGNEQTQKYGTDKYNIDAALERYRLQKNLEGKAQESYQSGYDWRRDLGK